MTPSGPTSPRKAEEEAANSDNARLVCEPALPPLKTYFSFSHDGVKILVIATQFK